MPLKFNHQLALVDDIDLMEGSGKKFKGSPWPLELETALKAVAGYGIQQEVMGKGKILVNAIPTTQGHLNN